MKRNRRSPSTQQGKVDHSSLPSSESVVTNSQDDSLKYEVEILLHEYQITTTQVLHRLEADEKGAELNLLTITAAVAAATFAVQYKAYALLLVLTIPSHVLIWG